MLPGDPARLALGAYATQEQVENLKHKMGMDRPLFFQYLAFIRGILHGDLGLSFLTRRSVSLDIAHHFPATLELVIVTIVWVLVIGVPLGILAGRYKDSWIDNLSRVIAFGGVAVPAFIFGLVGQLVFSYGLGILPTTGRLGMLTVKPPSRTGLLIIDSLIAMNFGALGDSLKHIILPSFSLAMAGIGQITRVTRGSVSDVLEKDYIEVARVFGIPNRFIIFKYMLKPSIIPPMTIVGLIFASQLGNAFLVEQVFGWPGMAKYGINAIMEKDFNALMGVVLIVGLAFVGINFIIDILAGYLDPRIQIQEES
jgi:ABC-type dipeptide/oligopeptide/nickel transport system permease component